MQATGYYLNELKRDSLSNRSATLSLVGVGCASILLVFDIDPGIIRRGERAGHAAENNGGGEGRDDELRHGKSPGDR